MKIETLFLDTEFTCLHQRAQLISLALVSADRSFYAEFNDFSHTNLTGWHQENVINKLLFKELDTYEDIQVPDWRLKNTTAQVATQLRAFLQGFPKVEIWSDVLAYDWMLFCELFGGAMRIPENIFYIPGDISTLLRVKGYDPDISRESLLKEQDLKLLQDRDLQKHNALYDAYLMQSIYYQLN